MKRVTGGKQQMMGGKQPLDSSENGCPSAWRRGWGGSHLTIGAPDPVVQPRLGSRQAAEDWRKTQLLWMSLMGVSFAVLLVRRLLGMPEGNTEIFTDCDPVLLELCVVLPSSQPSCCARFEKVVINLKVLDSSLCSVGSGYICPTYGKMNYYAKYCCSTLIEFTKKVTNPFDAESILASDDDMDDDASEGTVHIIHAVEMTENCTHNAPAAKLP
ncbi:hypothetical protein NDU88_001152 [Pleurodeles waltl]|uniref:Uncharacterized protein n=1 Tax=Pleurodeles waltl TaxID=8319 RepID=A0AAV7Q989_PLEWA|nr:hypothetical protein NDU88_001152 [Pleurodeles waltl]